MVPTNTSAAAVRAVIGPYAGPQEAIEQKGDAYRQLLGFVPPRIQARFNVTGALDSKILDLQEAIRTHAMNPTCLDQKTVQLMLFGMLLMDLSDAAHTHALAARRAGASWEEMQAVISLCYLFRGLSAANRGAEVMAQLAQREHDTALTGAKS